MQTFEKNKIGLNCLLIIHHTKRIYDFFNNLPGHDKNTNMPKS